MDVDFLIGLCVGYDTSPCPGPSPQGKLRFFSDLFFSLVLHNCPIAQAALSLPDRQKGCLQTQGPVPSSLPSHRDTPPFHLPPTQPGPCPGTFTAGTAVASTRLLVSFFSSSAVAPSGTTKMKFLRASPAAGATRFSG